MTQKIFFIHTVTGLTEMFAALCREILGSVELCHVSDEGLIRAVLAAGGLTPAVYRRLCQHVVAAEAAGADVIQLTCSSVSPCADMAGFLVSTPVLKIDEPMIERAVAGFRRIGVIATSPTTLAPTTELLRAKARSQERTVEIESVFCEGAYDAFLAGKQDEYERIVIDYLREVMAKVDVVLLAQASMARVADLLDDNDKTTPILSSPRPAVEHLAVVLKERSHVH